VDSHPGLAGGETSIGRGVPLHRGPIVGRVRISWSMSFRQRV
jgi:hypothetical protein